MVEGIDDFFSSQTKQTLSFTLQNVFTRRGTRKRFVVVHYHINIANYEEHKEGIKRRLENHLSARKNALTNRLGDDSISQRNL